MPQPKYSSGAPAGRFERLFAKIAHALGRPEPLEERRAQRRIPIHGAARMVSSGVNDGPLAAVVNMVDISERGLCIRSASAVVVDDPILLNDGSITIFGVVRHCTEEGKEFTIGVKLCPPEEAVPQYATRRLLEA